MGGQPGKYNLSKTKIQYFKSKIFFILANFFFNFLKSIPSNKNHYSLIKFVSEPKTLHQPTMTTIISSILLLLLPLITTSFYLPGVAPQSWNDGDSVTVSTDSLTSPKTRLPYDYYDFPFCRPKIGIVAMGETLGEIFAGMRVESTGYKVKMAVDTNCEVLCEMDMKKEEVLKIKKLIDDQYVVNLMVSG